MSQPVARQEGLGARMLALRRRVLTELSRGLDLCFRSPIFLRSLHRGQRLSFGFYALHVRGAGNAIYAWKCVWSNHGASPRELTRRPEQ